MTTHGLNKPFVLAGTALAVGFSFSCSTISHQASSRSVHTVRIVNKNGLIEYRTYDMGRSSITGAIAQKKPASQPPPAARPAPVVPQAPAIPVAPVVAKSKAPLRSFSPPDMLSTGKVLVAQNVPSQPGFVRSPYTNPPRLVIVKDATPGTTMICPYTQKPFIVPEGYVNAPANLASARTETPELATRNASMDKASPADSKPKVVINQKEFDGVFPPTPEASKTSPLSSNFATAPVNITPGHDSKGVQEVPYGDPISGRPGFVNSPYAAKHQLVDVTGLPAGMEVKCPYSGKLFRVPPQDMAAGKPAETSTPLVSPEEPKKN